MSSAQQSRLNSFLQDLVPAKGPERILAIGTLINTIGNGLFFTTSVLFFTRIVGFSGHQVGLALSIAGAVGLLVSIPGGHLADQIGPRNIAVVIRLLEGVLMAIYAFVSTFAVFLFLVIGIAVLESAGQSMRSTLIARLGGSEGRVRLRAVLRSVTNLGMTAGAAIAAIALAVDTKEAYQACILANALSMVFSGLILLRLENIEALPQARENKMTMALKDRPYVALAMVNAVLTIQFMVLEIALPLWISQHTNAPRWMVAVVLIINTVVVALFQVRASRGSNDIQHAGMVLRNSGFILGTAALIYASAAYFDAPLVAALILAIGSGIQVVGEMLQSAGSWGIGFGLPPEHAQGQYQGVWSLGFSLSGMIGPAFLTVVVVGNETAGWAILAALFVSAGIAVRPLLAWALRNRPHLV